MNILQLTIAKIAQLGVHETVNTRSNHQYCGNAFDMHNHKHDKHDIYIQF